MLSLAEMDVHISWKYKAATKLIERH